MATVHRARAVLKVKRRKTGSVVGRANAMCNGIDNNPSYFPNPNPPTSVMKDQIGVVNKAEDLVRTGTKGSAASRRVQLNVLVGMLETQTNYIQGVADKSPTWDHAVAIIQAGGLVVATVPTHPVEILKVEKGPTLLSVTLRANVAALTAGLKGKFFFNWQSTVDGKTFVTLPSTPNHKTTVENLIALTNYGFRVSVTDASGIQGEWSQTVYFLVH
jgi:hypothetical protein